ncbi:MAG: VOC family protein [Patescibacteria group bacterium]
MLNHVSLHVNDLEGQKRFYLAALAQLGFETIVEFTNAVGIGIAGRPELWIKGDGARGQMHIAFSANNRKGVDAFHAAGLLAGGKDNGTPGIRQRPYVTNYAAFVIDPEGNNIEVVAD